jgi:hypothetical protein
MDPDNIDPQLYDALNDLFPDEIRDALLELQMVGEIYSPKPGIFKVVNAIDL